MIIDFEYHYILVELGRRLGMKMDSKIAVRQGDALAGKSIKRSNLLNTVG